MVTQLQKVNRRKRISFLSSIISISMVLLMLGLFGLIYIQSKQLNKLIKENIVMSVFLNEDISKTEIDFNIESIKKIKDVKDVKFISKEEAANEMSKEYGQDVVELAGYNPLPSSIEITLKQESVKEKSIQELKKVLLTFYKVSEVKYNEIISKNVVNNLGSFGLILIGLSIIFVIISLVLINSNIRLNLFTKRFSIKSMQLVGATHWFIIKPLVFRSFFNGLYGGILSITILILILYLIPNYFPQIEVLYNTNQFVILFIILLFTGILVSMVSSYVSTNKYLKSKIEDLY
ncbi:MAG: permease-like cell division protein FtsX [Bacteroidota bacterium]